MLESFCAGANLKAFLQKTTNPTILKEAATIIDQATDQRPGVTLMMLMRTLDSKPSSRENLRHSDFQWKKLKTLDEVVSSSLKVSHNFYCAQIKGWFLPPEVFIHKRLTIWGTVYTIRTESVHDSAVFFQLMGSDSCIPGIIWQFFSVPCQFGVDEFREEFFIAIQRYSALKAPQSDDPFLPHVDFGAQLWSE